MLDARMVRHSGIGTYVRGLLGEYREHPFFYQNALGLALPPSLSSEVNGTGQVYPFRSSIYSLQEQIEYPFRLRHCRLWHAPHYNVPLLKGNTRLVVTIHDLIHWIFRKEFYSPLQAAYANLLIQKALSSADRIIAVSQKTKDDLVKHLRAPESKITVIYEGVSPVFFTPSEPQERRRICDKYSLPEKFFLYVGLIKPHKNIKRLLSVFQKLREAKKIDSHLVLVGKKDRRYSSGFEDLAQLKTGEGIHYLENVESQKELSALYASAVALVHPSLYEGFGLTILEAMASRTPVIVSNAGSLPEVAGEAGYFIDPASEDSLASALQKIEKGETLRNELVKKGLEQARKFSWQKAADQTIEVYKEVLNSK